MGPLLSLLVVAALTVLAFYVVGAGLLRLLQLASPSPLLAVFLRLVFGSSAVLVLYSVVRTGGNTVMAGLVLLLGGLAWQLRRWGTGAPALGETAFLAPPGPARSRWASGGGGGALALGAVVLLTALRFPLLYNFGTGHYDAPFVDFIFYGKTAFQLNALGLESITFAPTGSGLQAAQPYHYFELWLNALLLWATTFPPGVTVFMLTYSILLTVVYFGFCALMETFGHSLSKALLLGAACLFIMGIFLPVFHRSAILVNNLYGLQPYLIVRPKLAPAYIFMLLGFVLYVRQNRPAAFWSWAVVPLVFISTGPALLVSLGVLALVLAVQARYRLATLGQLLLPVLAVAGFMAGFYLLNARLGSPHQGLSPGVGAGLAALLPQPREWHTVVNVVAGMLLAFAAYYFIYVAGLLLLALPHPRQAWRVVQPYSGLLLLVAGGGLVGAVLAGVGLHFVDAGQFFDNLATVSTAVLVATLLAALLRGRSAKWFYAVFGAFAGFIALNVYTSDGKLAQHMTSHYNPAFLDAVTQVAPKLSQEGAYVMGAADRKKYGRFGYKSYLCTPGFYLSVAVPQEAILFSLSHLGIDPEEAVATAPANSVQMRNEVEQAPIRQFARQYRARHPGLGDAAVQRAFVLQQHINFVCVSPGGELPGSLQPLVRRVLQDDVTHERMYLLNVQ